MNSEKWVESVSGGGTFVISISSAVRGAEEVGGGEDGVGREEKGCGRKQGRGWDGLMVRHRNQPQQSHEQYLHEGSWESACTAGVVQGAKQASSRTGD